KRIAASDRRHRDFTLNTLAFAIREYIAALPVYRTYVDPQSGEISPVDEAIVRSAIEDAKRSNSGTDPSLFDFLGEVILKPGDADESVVGERLDFVARLQQTTGPVAAKGVEDT